MTRAPRTIACAALVALPALPLGCATDTGPTDARLRERASVADSPVVDEEANGVDIRWWFTDDSNGSLARALGPHAAAPVGIGESRRDALRASGVRIARITLDEADAVLEQLDSLGSRKHTWLTPTGRWSQVYTGRRVGPSVPVMLGGRRTHMDPGTLRLLARTWVSRTLDGPILRAGLAAQNKAPPPPPGESFFERPAFKSEPEKGPILDPIAFTLTLEEGHVWVITCAAPDDDWQRRSQPGQQADTPEKSQNENESDAPSPRRELAFPQTMPGPPAKRPLTVGEILLSLRPEETGGRTIKTVVVIVPRLPSDTRLLQ